METGKENGFNIQKLLPVFFAESREMLGSMECCLLKLEKDSEDRETMNGLFRAVHTIKGSSGMYGLTEVEDFTHHVENILDSLRMEDLKFDEVLSAVLLECHDYIHLLIDMFESDINAQLNEDLLNEKCKLIAELEEHAQILEPGIDDSDNTEEQLPGTILTCPDVETLTESEQNEIMMTSHHDEYVVEEESFSPVDDKRSDGESGSGQNQKIIKKSVVAKNETIRIKSEKIDNLINLVGELVISGSHLKTLADNKSDDDITESISDMLRLVEDIRNDTMSVKMVPVGETFGKFERVVHDLSHQQEKKIEMIVVGGETELDKSLVDTISDPLMHIIRNSVDHSIGTPAERIARDKPETGTIKLNAYHETGNVVIEVSDDGMGLDREKIRQRAVERGILSPDADIADDELFQYIFEPGFSTSQKVTNISGRGVGMDVVRRNIESMRGTVSIESEWGEGTVIQITLPLTLAIIDGFMVRVEDSYFIIPLDSVIECTETCHNELNHKESGNFIEIRDEVIPFLRLRDFFGQQESAPEKENIVIVESFRKKAGIVVDSLYGEFQTVVKPLNKIFSRLEWVSGATVLGNGHVALILDVLKLVQHSKESFRQEIA